MLLKLKRIAGIFGLLVFALIFSCEKEPLLIACDDCTGSIPLETSVGIKLSQRPNKTVMYRVYLGNFEDNILIASFSSSSDKTSVKLPVNKKYTITVEYTISNDVYVAVDSVYPRVGFNKEQCDDPCYYVYDKTANLSLKHQ